jgi:hypothetical protein
MLTEEEIEIRDEAYETIKNIFLKILNPCRLKRKWLLFILSLSRFIELNEKREMSLETLRQGADRAEILIEEFLAGPMLDFPAFSAAYYESLPLESEDVALILGDPDLSLRIALIGNRKCEATKAAPSIGEDPGPPPELQRMAEKERRLIEEGRGGEFRFHKDPDREAYLRAHFKFHGIDKLCGCSSS